MEGQDEVGGAAGGQQGRGGALEGGILVAVKDVLVGIGEPELVQQHLIKAHIPQLQHLGSHPVGGGGAGGIQPVGVAVGPQALLADMHQAGGDIVQAEIVILEGADPGDGVEALAFHGVQQAGNAGDVHAGGDNTAAQLGIIVAGTLGAVHVHHDGGAGVQTLQLEDQVVDAALEHVGVDVIAIDLGHVVADVDGVGAFVKVDGHILGGSGRGGDLADDVVGGMFEIQPGTIVGEDNVALEPDYPADPADEEQQQRDQSHGAHPVQCPPGAVGDTHRLLLSNGSP